MRVVFKWLVFVSLIASCDISNSQELQEIEEYKKEAYGNINELNEVESYYLSHKNDSLESRSTGTPGKGTLENGTLLPFEGSNYSYFSVDSYLKGRAFMHRDVARIILGAFKKLEQSDSLRSYIVMECSNEHGGKLEPHRTHQNGMSVDLMCAKKKEGKPFTDLDTMGPMHYFIDFDEHGFYLSDKSVSLDFEAIAKEMYYMHISAKEHGYEIEKIIFMLELKDELFATEYGRKLQSEGVYFAQNLPSIVNQVHDDHFHIDFKKRR